MVSKCCGEGERKGLGVVTTSQRKSRDNFVPGDIEKGTLTRGQFLFFVMCVQVLYLFRRFFGDFCFLDVWAGSSMRGGGVVFFFANGGVGERASVNGPHRAVCCGGQAKKGGSTMLCVCVCFVCMRQDRTFLLAL